MKIRKRGERKRTIKRKRGKEGPVSSRRRRFTALFNVLGRMTKGVDEDIVVGTTNDDNVDLMDWCG
mgnify:CR=1 FL=1